MRTSAPPPKVALGVGSGQAQLLSAVTVASDRDKPELNSGSLHRYLAEAVWYPTALLPSAGCGGVRSTTGGPWPH
ncbi:DUF6920 family protein [Aromatoleum anaerobium]|uniref:DUF6920 family protein n=1 Tax=Aromatoleum anaerobium TaxID=182180 RepID=UPI003CCFF48F